ncbi:MAG: serine hydrolase domain-containing protein [Myxococcota bacterium]|nr:serine hydrolase domain-containing protein [Myxococcota bacterium]
MSQRNEKPGPSNATLVAGAGLLTMLAVLLASCGGAREPSPPTPGGDRLTRRLDRVLEAAVEECRVVGAVLLVSRDGELVYRRAVGWADRERRLPLREDALFRYASVTKPFVATAALVLVRRGALSLEDPVDRYLPDFRPRLPDGSTPPISIRHLLTHTSGLGYSFSEPDGGPYHEAGVSDGLDAPGLAFEENARRLATVPLLARPGTAFNYSLSTDVLGEVVARAHGTSLPEAVTELVLRPLGLAAARFHAHGAADLVVPYADGDDCPVRMEEGHRVPFGASALVFSPRRALDPRSYPSGGAGMLGTPGELMTLLEALRVGDERLLPRDTALGALRDQLSDSDTSWLGEGMGFGYVGSVVTDPRAAGRDVNAGTVQWGGVYGHSWWIDPVSRRTVVLMTNTTLEGMSGQLASDVEAAALSRD